MSPCASCTKQNILLAFSILVNVENTYSQVLFTMFYLFLGTTFSECGGNIPESVTTIKYPQAGKYSNSKICRWSIRFTTPVTLRFISFSLERHSSCNYDYLKISKDGAVVWKYCGNKLPPSVTAGNIDLKFRSDSSVTYNGFTISLTRIKGNLFMLFVIIIYLTICVSQCL